jgi:LacI family transcriptional regulator
VSQKLRAIHLKAAGELGYIPNRAAQQLRKASRESVAVITASTSNSYYLDLMAGIQHALKPANWTVVVADVAVDGVYESLLEDRIVRRLIESRTAGVISTLTLKPENTKLFANWDIPVVFVDSSPPANAANFPSVTTDNYNASLLVGQHLAEHGYKDWTFLVYPTKWSTRFDRLHNARVDVIECDNDSEAAYEALGVHLSKSKPVPQVLIAGNNPLLLGALKLLRHVNAE